MKSEIKSIFSPDIDMDLKEYKPIKLNDFGLLLEIDVGIENEKGADIFNIMLCSPQWLTENFQSEEIVLGLHYIIMFEYNYDKLYKKLQELMCIEGKDWDEIATKLSYIAIPWS